MAALTSNPVKTKRNWRKFWRQYGVGYLFVLPGLAIYLLFVVYPFVSSIYLSLTDWNGADAERPFVGLANYIRLLQDDLFWLSLRHNLMWMVVGAAVPIALGLFLALLVWKRPFGFTIFRTVYFLPQVLGAGILGVMWKLVYQPRRGILHQIGEAAGIEALQFSPLADVDQALWAVLIAAIWASIGFFFVIMLAGLQNVDTDLLDAATVDGANNWQRFQHVIIPQLSHVITMVTVLAFIGGLKIFGIIWAMTQGGPANGTEVIATYAYVHFSQLSEVGYSAALTTVMAALALIITLIFMRLRERET